MQKSETSNQPTGDAEPTTTLSGLIATTEAIDPPDDPAPESDGRCMICAADPIGCYPFGGSAGVFSNAFTSAEALNPGDGICYRCRHLAKWMDFRRYHWVADGTGVEIIKKRPRLIERLLDPPDGPWMVQYKDGSDFLTVLNGWLYAQRLNTSRDQYRLLVNKQTVDIDRQRFAEHLDFASGLRARENQISKRALKAGVTAGDLGRYDIDREEYQRINTDLVGREDWRIAVQLVE